MLGLSIQYSYKAININVIKYWSTFLSKCENTFFSVRNLKYTDELRKMRKRIPNLVSYLGNLERDYKILHFNN